MQDLRKPASKLNAAGTHTEHDKHDAECVCVFPESCYFPVSQSDVFAASSVKRI